MTTILRSIVGAGRAWIWAALLLMTVHALTTRLEAATLTLPQEFSIETSGTPGTVVIHIDKTAMTVRDPLAEPIYGSGNVLGFSDDLYYVAGLTAGGFEEPLAIIPLRYTFFTSGEAATSDDPDNPTPSIAIISRTFFVPAGITTIRTVTYALKHYNVGGGPTVVRLDLDDGMLATPAPPAFALFASAIGMLAMVRRRWRRPLSVTPAVKKHLHPG